MNHSFTADMSFNPRHIIVLFAGLVLSVLIGSIASAQVDGFTEPFRTIELSSDEAGALAKLSVDCLLYTSPSPRDLSTSRMPSSA